MSKNTDNVTKTKKSTSGGGINPRPKRKSYRKLSDSSSISSNRNSSEDDIRVEKNDSGDEQEQKTKKLQAQVKELRHKLRILEDSIDSKDYSLGTISREKDRAIGEIRRLERSNKLLRQQLNDERNHYWEEKEKFCEEMTKYKRKLQDVKSNSDGRKSNYSGKQPLINQSLVRQFSKQRGDYVDEKSKKEIKKSKSHSMEMKTRKSGPPSYFSFTDLRRKSSSQENLHIYGGHDVLLQVAALRTENARLRSIICERDEQNYELCLRFLRMKHSKNDIRDRFQGLENEYLQVIANLMDKIDEARQEFNFIIDQKFKRPLHTTNAMYLQMVQKNSRIAFENAALRLENQCLKRELNKYIHEYDSIIRRRTESPRSVELVAKASTESSKIGEKVKTIKKNVNFKEVRTIFERSQTYRYSDTDSNYLSKTPTSRPSNGSLRDTKSIPEETEEEKKISSEENTVPEEVLKKVFLRVDSCQSTELTQNHDPKELSKSTKPEKPKKESYFWLGRNPWKEQPLLKNHIEWRFDNPKGSTSLNFPLRKITLTRKSKVSQEVLKSEVPHRFDNCGLQEKFELSDLELPRVGNQRLDAGNPTREKPEHEIVRIELLESEEDLGGNERIKTIPPAVGSRSRSSNKLNLRDELMEANMRQITSSESWRKGSKIGTTQSGISINASISSKSMRKNIQFCIQETGRSGKDPHPPQRKRGEACKRFSHRLCTRSPEELKQILTDGALQMPPTIVGHASTEVTSTLKPADVNDSFMQLILPPTTSERSTVPSQTGDIEWVTAQKETSFSEISLGCPRKSTNQTDMCASGVLIPVSSVPTSNSTVEVLDKTVLERGTMIRTLSAPGLLESSWLDPYSICEMRDCRKTVKTSSPAAVLN